MLAGIVSAGSENPTPPKEVKMFTQIRSKRSYLAALAVVFAGVVVALAAEMIYQGARGRT